MRQTSLGAEKIDPLVRIQEEIREVKRREHEYRQLKAPASTDDSRDYGSYNGHSGVCSTSGKDCIATSPVSSDVQTAAEVSLTVTDESSLSSSVNSKESLDGNHSDDSGISASSSPVNGTSANGLIPSGKERRYIGPNTYNRAPVPPPQKLVTRTVSTPQIFTPNRIIAHSSSQKGLMQRFIASRGRLMLRNCNSGAVSAAAFGLNANTDVTTGVGLIPADTSATPSHDFSVRSPATMVMPTLIRTAPVIERDPDGKPIRRGYIPVEVKIQRELKDYKSRESELRKYRKLRESTPDLLDAINIESMASDDEDSDAEHCYGPGKLRATKSISELCDSLQSNNSVSQRITTSPDCEDKPNLNRGIAMRPAMSLAQLCDLDPEDAPSSHRLIAQWESIIKQNEQKLERE